MILGQSKPLSQRDLLFNISNNTTLCYNLHCRSSLWSLLMTHVLSLYPLFFFRMDTTEQCNAVISHFNGKFLKIASGALGRKKNNLSVHFPSNKNCGGSDENNCKYVAY